LDHGERHIYFERLEELSRNAARVLVYLLYNPRVTLAEMTHKLDMGVERTLRNAYTELFLLFDATDFAELKRCMPNAKQALLREPERGMLLVELAGIEEPGPMQADGHAVMTRLVQQFSMEIKQIEAQSGALNQWVEYALHECEDGIRFTGGLERFLALAVYLDFCLRYAGSEVRAPDAWPDLKAECPDPASSRPGAPRIGVITLANYIMGESAPDVARYIKTMPPSRDASDDYLRAAETGELLKSDAGWGVFQSAISSVPKERTAQQRELIAKLSRSLLGNESALKAFSKFIVKIDEDHAESLNDVLAMNEPARQPDVMTPTEVGTDKNAVRRAKSLVASSTLGGAWLLRYCLALITKDPDVRQASDRDAALRVGDAEVALASEFWLSLADCCQRNGGVALVLQHPFQDRVLWEVLNRSNSRYPAEMLLVRSGLREFTTKGALFAGTRIAPCPGIQVCWYREPLPVVGEFTAELAEWSGDPESINQSTLSDYPAYGRTNASNWFLRTKPPNDSVSSKAMRTKDWDPFNNPANDLDADFFWTRDDPGAGADWWQIHVINARSSTLRGLEALRKQMAIARLLSTDGGVKAKPRTGDLLAIGWFSYRTAESDFRKLLCSRDEPRFWNPYTWLGQGLAKALVHEAEVAVMMTTAFERLGGARGYELGWIELSRRKVARYVKEEYLTELDRITFLFQYLSTLLDGTDSKEEREELAASVARITRCREILELWLEPIKQALA
jgi:hypothetical protein